MAADRDNTARDTSGRDAPHSAWRTVAFSALGFAVTVGAVLGLAGFRTSGFTLSLVPAQVVPVLVAFVLVYAALASLFVLITTRRRRASALASERPVFHALSSVTLWVALVLMFLPLKGSEAFVSADRLTTIQLNAIGLAVILLAGWVLGWTVARILSSLLSALRMRLPAGRVLRLGASYAALAIVVLAVGAGVRSRGTGDASAPADTPRVAIIGVDGCDWDKLGPLVESGRLPNFRRLMDRGAYGPLRSAAPLVSPRIWTTIATGKTPEKHGILGFVNEAGVPVNTTMRTAAPVWDIVASFGLPVGVVGWYVTWPVGEVNGFLISDRMHSLLRGPVQVFQTLTGRPTNDRLETFGAFDFDPSYKGYPKDGLAYQQNRIVDEPLRWGYLRDAIYSRLATALSPSYRPALSAVYLRGVDFVQHFFWQYSDPGPFEGVAEADVAAYGGVIDNYYEYTDTLLGRLLDAYGEDVNVFIVADHGFQARLDLDPGRPQLTGTHDFDGVLIAAGPDIAPAGEVEGVTIFDVAPTVLAVMGLPVGEDMDGRVVTEIISRESLSRRPVTYVPSYESVVGRRRDEVGSTMDDSIKEQLRSLGYIE